MSRRIARVIKGRAVKPQRFVVDDSGGWIAIGPRYGERAFNGRPVGGQEVEVSIDRPPVIRRVDL